MAIPTLDLRLAESDRDEAARQLIIALEDPGFLYLQNVKGYQPGKSLVVLAFEIYCSVGFWDSTLVCMLHA